MENTFTKEIVCPAFRQKVEEQRVLPASAALQLPSTQNNSFARVMYFGTAYSDPLQSHNAIITINMTPYHFLYWN